MIGIELAANHNPQITQIAQIIFKALTVFVLDRFGLKIIRLLGKSWRDSRISWKANADGDSGIGSIKMIGVLVGIYHFDMQIDPQIKYYPQITQITRIKAQGDPQIKRF